VTLLLPLLAFLSGLFLASTPLATRLKTGFSSLLARCFIPIVIVYNMVFYQAGSFSLMLFSFVVAVLLFYFFLYFSKNKLSALCFSYVNMAWLGFPFAIALFGTEISPAMVALYIGGSIFGNLWAVTAVSQTPLAFSFILKKVLCAPPMIE
jgi:malate permease and related proteins